MMGSKQDAILQILKSSDRPMTAKEIAEVFHPGDVERTIYTTRGPLNATLRKMEKWGIVECVGTTEVKGFQTNLWRAV